MSQHDIIATRISPCATPANRHPLLFHAITRHYRPQTSPSTTATSLSDAHMVTGATATALRRHRHCAATVKRSRQVHSGRPRPDQQKPRPSAVSRPATAVKPRDRPQIDADRLVISHVASPCSASPHWTRRSQGCGSRSVRAAQRLSPLWRSLGGDGREDRC